MAAVPVAFGPTSNHNRQDLQPQHCTHADFAGKPIE
jgi:hypothetical protein